MTTNAVITIYHAIFNIDERRTEYRKHTTSASWHVDHRVNVDSAGINSAETYRVRVPKEELKDYLPPDEYLEAGQPKDKWTVDNGDYFIKGEGPEIAKISDVKNFSKVNSWSDNRRGVLQHVRIVGW